jgi:hypothetical protein
MITRASGAMGEPFIFGNMTMDWNRLVTILIQETIGGAVGTARRKRQHSIVYGFNGDFNKFNFANVDYPLSDDPQGIPIIFITPDLDG